MNAISKLLSPLRNNVNDGLMMITSYPVPILLMRRRHFIGRCDCPNVRIVQGSYSVAFENYQF